MSSIPPTWAEACPRLIWRWTDSMSQNRIKRLSGQFDEELRNIIIHNIAFQNLHSSPVHVLSISRCHPPLPLLCLPLEESSHDDHWQQGEMTNTERDQLPQLPPPIFLFFSILLCVTQNNLTTVEPSLSSLVIPDGLVPAEPELLSLDAPQLDSLDYGGTEPRYDQSAFTKQSRGEKIWTEKEESSQMSLSVDIIVTFHLSLSSWSPLVCQACRPPPQQETTWRYSRPETEDWSKMMRRWCKIIPINRSFTLFLVLSWEYVWLCDWWQYGVEFWI